MTKQTLQSVPHWVGDKLSIEATGFEQLSTALARQFSQLHCVLSTMAKAQLSDSCYSQANILLTSIMADIQQHDRHLQLLRELAVQLEQCEPDGLSSNKQLSNNKDPASQNNVTDQSGKVVLFK